MGFKRKTWRELNVRFNLSPEQREVYREFCEQLLNEKKEECSWPFLDDAVAQDILLPQITVLGKKAKQQVCYATCRPILPGQTMVVIKSRPFPQFDQESKILANFFDQETLIAFLENRKVSACA